MVSKEFIKKQKMSVRKYENYEEYVEHQKSKLGIITWMDKYDRAYREVLLERLNEVKLKMKGAFEIKGKKVLCLAARIGTEVKAFIDMGADARGIDLNPGPDNKWVDVGDFHDIKRDDNSMDIVFTNSFDHSLEPQKLVSEVKRILKKEGYFLMEAGWGGRAGSWECLEWESLTDVIKLFTDEGFKLLSQKRFSKRGRYTPNGDQLLFQL